MDELHAHGALADRGGDPLYASAAYVSRGEDSGRTRLQQVRATPQGPRCRGQIVRAQIRSRFHEAAVVERHTTLQPLRVWRGTGHQKNVTDVVPLGLRFADGLPSDSLEPIRPVESCQLRVTVQLDIRALFDATNQVARHAVRQTARAHQYVHATAGGCEKYRRLTRRVAPADHDDFLSLAKGGFQMRRGVVDAGAHEASYVLDVEYSILRTGGDQNYARTDEIPIRQQDPIRAGSAAQADCRSGNA